MPGAFVMGGRQHSWAALVGVTIVGFGCSDDARAQTSNNESTAISATTAVEPADRDGLTAATQAPRPQQQLARIWANEPPLVQLARNRFGGEFTEADAKFFTAVAANDWA